MLPLCREHQILLLLEMQESIEAPEPMPGEQFHVQSTKKVYPLVLPWAPQEIKPASITCRERMPCTHPFAQDPVMPPLSTSNTLARLEDACFKPVEVSKPSKQWSFLTTADRHWSGKSQALQPRPGSRRLQTAKETSRCPCIPGQQVGCHLLFLWRRKSIQEDAKRSEFDFGPL